MADVHGMSEGVEQHDPAVGEARPDDEPQEARVLQGTPHATLPGLVETPMGVDTRVRLTHRPREEIVAERAARVPLKGHRPTGWDVANAALFLASDEAAFVTGVALPVDGGALVRIGESRAN